MTHQDDEFVTLVAAKEETTDFMIYLKSKARIVGIIQTSCAEGPIVPLTLATSQLFDGLYQF